MKKKLASFFTCFFIILIFGGVVFFIGWTQFKIEPNNFGILVSKTNGIKSQPINSGKFSWNWQFLIPTNAQLKIFTQEPYSITKTVKNSLPNGAIYKELYNKNLDFSYELDFSINVKISPENTLKLLQENLITDQTSLTNYINKAAEVATQTITTYCLKNSEKNFNFRPESISSEELISISNISEQFPELEFTSINIISSKLLDYDLYIKARNLYIQNFDTLNKKIAEI